MTRLSDAFARAREQGRAALVTFVTGGDPSPAATPAILDALVAGGADVIELGLPFTDPMADGPAIQRANLRALGAGTRTTGLLAVARDFRVRHPHVPLVLMGYANPMLRRGPDWFAAACADHGVDGVICVDVPAEEDAAIGPALRAHGVDVIRLATPTTDAARLPAVLEGAGGFLYYVSVAGITGMQQAATPALPTRSARLKADTALPVAVGFGVRTPDQARAIAQVADGVVVGSAIIDLIEAAQRAGRRPAPDITALVSTLGAGRRDARRGCRMSWL